MAAPTPTTPPAKPDYGIDAPGVVRTFALLGSAGLAVAAIAFFVFDFERSGLAFTLFNMGLWPGLSFLATAGIMLWGSRFGKLRLRDKILDGIEWRGDERVLDVGCGRGLMLVGAARRIPNGKAVGVDIWQAVDLSGNTPDNTRANAAAEGVADRVEVRDGDARTLPFEEASFDVVLSSTALHNIYDPVERAKAVREIARVTKPGGRVAIFDIRHSGEYAAVLKDLGWAEVERSRPYFLFVIPARVVTARKPTA